MTVVVSPQANGRNGVSARKAARASASTPETARGIVSLSQGLTKKATRVSTPHRGRKSGSVDKTPSPRKGSPLVRGSPSKRGFAVKSLSPQFSKTPPKKKLSLKQKALLPFMPRKASTKHGSHREASSKQAVLEGSQVNNAGTEACTLLCIGLLISARSLHALIIMNFLPASLASSFLACWVA